MSNKLKARGSRALRAFLLIFFGWAALNFSCQAWSADKKIVLIAGHTSHGPGDHEFRAGCLLLKKCLESVPGIHADVYDNDWPKDNSAFEGASAVLIYADGGGSHPAFKADHAEIIQRLIDKGVGLGCAHYGVEVEKGEPGQAMQRWIGGYYEHLYSVNPMWKPEFSTFTNHPVTRGVKPFALLDEWYFNIRFAEPVGNADTSLEAPIPSKTGRIIPILVSTPSEKVRKGPYVYPQGPYDHIIANNGRKEAMMWLFERPDGGRGFGFTGGHKHVNWSNENLRKVVLNGLLWLAKVDVPPNGVISTVSPEEITQNLDTKPNAVPLNITGKWNVSVETANGNGSPSFTFVHAGQNLLGSYAGRFGEAQVSGSVRTNDVKWTFDVQVQDRLVTCIYKGTIETKDSMKGTVNLGDYEGSWIAKRE